MRDRSSIGVFRLMRSIDEYLGPPLCLVLGIVKAASALIRPRPSSTPSTVRKVLVIKFWGMGSIVLTTPALRALKASYPDCQITFLTFAQNETLCRMIAAIDRVYPYAGDGLAAFLGNFVALVRFMRREQFDVVIDFEFFANFTSIVTGLSGAPSTVGFRSFKFWREPFYTTRVPFAQRHITENFLEAVRALGATPDGLALDTVAVTNDQATTELGQLLTDRHVARTDHLICVNINASSLDYKRRWPQESYRQLIERILNRFGEFKIVLIGSKDEVPYVTELVEALAPSPNVVNLCGQIGVEQLILLLQRARLFIGNDSGPLHLAAAVGIPTVSFFGPETPDLYGPRGTAHTILYKGIACSPCLNVHNSKDNSSCRNNICMKTIAVDEAWAAVDRRLTDISGAWSSEAAGGVR